MNFDAHRGPSRFRLAALCGGLALLMMLASAGMAQSAKKKSDTKAEDGDRTKSNPLGDLNKPMGDCVDAMSDFLTAKKEGGNKPLGKLKVNELAQLRDDFSLSLRKATDAKVSPEIQVIRDSFLVYASQGLKGMNMVLTGIDKRSADMQEKGWEFCRLASEDLQSINRQAGGTSAETAGSGPGNSIGKSTGINGFASFASGSSNYNLSLSESFPLTANIDWGASVNAGLQSSSYSGGGSTTTNSSLSDGISGFIRYNFLQFFKDKPWIVPFAGAQVGWTYSTSSSSVAGSTASSSTSSSYGIQAGSLLFFNRQTALNLQIEDDFSPPTSSPSIGSSSGSGGGGTTSTITLSVGLRFTR